MALAPTEARFLDPESFGRLPNRHATGNLGGQTCGLGCCGLARHTLIALAHYGNAARADLTLETLSATAGFGPTRAKLPAVTRSTVVSPRGR